MRTHYLLDDLVHNASVLQVVEVPRGGGASNHPQLSYIGGLVGLRSDAYGEEADPLVLGISHSREDVRVPGVRDTVEEQHGDLDAAEGRLLQVHTGEVGDGVGGVGAVADVHHGSDPGLEVVGAPPLLEGLLYDDMAAVLKEGDAEAEAAARFQPEALKPVHHVHG